MEKHSTYMLAKIKLSDSESIMELAEFFRNSYHDLGGRVFEVCIALLKRMIHFSKKKEMKEVLSLVIEEALEVLEGDDLLFICHAYVLTNNYNSAYEENVILYENFVSKTNFYKRNDQYTTWLFLNISIAYKNLKKYEEAIEVLVKNNQSRIDLGDTYELAGEEEKAISLYKQIIKNSDNNDDVIHAHFNLFELFERRGEKKKSEKYLKSIEDDFLLTKKEKYKVTRCFLLYKHYKKKGNRVKSFRFLKMATLEYEASLDIDIQHKIAALKVGISEKKFPLPDILETYSKYKQFADSELVDLLQSKEVSA